MTRELVYRGAVFGIGEMLLAGVTTFVDMYYFEDEVARACVRTGMRGYLGETLISQPTCDSAQPGGGLEIARRMFDTWRGEVLVRPIVAPHGTTTCNEALLRAGVELAAGQNALFTLHASEMDYEMKYFAERGETPTRYLKRIGAGERAAAGGALHPFDHGRYRDFGGGKRGDCALHRQQHESGQRRGPDGGGGARGRSFRPWYGRSVLRQHAQPV